MSIFVFLGPSLKISDAKAILPTAYYLPPVACGDIISVLPLNPKVIVVIDGYFESQPAVWHKEIMYAMSLGIIVCGASSMGALRAAELYPFGMIGIGRIYENYKNLTIIGDDEVVLTHSFEMDNFKSYTIPMVNIRFSVEHAIALNIISSDVASEFLRKIKSIFYQDRTWEVLETEFKTSDKFNKLFIWLKANYIDQKKLDAKEVLHFVNNNQFPLKSNLVVSNTALLRNLKIEKLSMPLSFFYNWLPIDYKINSFARLFKEQYHASVLLAKVIGVGHDCGFIQLLPGKICRLNYEYNNDIYSQILNCFIKTSTKKIDITINNSFKLISKIVAIIYHKVKPDFDSIQNDKLLEVALNIFKKHGIDSAAKENHWFQKNNFTNKQFNFATFIFYFIDYFVTRKNLTLLFGSGSSEIYNYFSIALSLNGLDRVIVQTLISNKKELLHKNIIDLDLHGDNYAIAQDFKSAFEMRNFIHQISSLEISDSEILSLTTWTLQ